MIYSPISSPIRSAVSSLFANRGGFVPSRLFAAGEQGAWYDPSDFSRYMAAGPELVVNGDFSSGLTGWTAFNSTLSVVSGALRVTQTALFAGVEQSFQTLVGKTYRASGVVVADAITGSIFARANTAPMTELNLGSNLGKFEFLFVATATTTIFSLSGSSLGVTGQYYEVDNISVRELTALDTATMFQDSAGTTPVTAVEQPVGLMLDKSGRGNHATQTTSTSRPVLRQDAGGRYYLSFDGVDDFLVTNSIDFTSTDKMTVFAGVRKLSAATGAAVAELGPNTNTTPGVGLFAPSSVGLSDYAFTSRGAATAVAIASGFVAPTTNALSGLSSISGDSAILRINGAQAAQSTADQGTGNYGNYPLYIGRRGGTTAPFTGHLYSLIVRGAATSDTQVSQTETWVNGRTGAY